MRSLFLILLFDASALAQTRVIDGDSIEIDGVVFRLNGIDAPEQSQHCEDWPCGVAATDRLIELIADEVPRCEIKEQDKYGREIATCFVANKDLGATLVAEGLAWAFRRFSDAYVSLEDQAKADRLGIWNYESKPAWEFRKDRWNGEESKAPEGCPIKGNISENGMIYHTPWSFWYERTRVSTSKGERWFCSEAEALAAGWRAPYAK